MNFNYGRAAVLLLLSSFCLHAATNEEIYAGRIAPVLKEKCASCHSGASPAGNLALSSFDTLLAGGKRGPAMVPGSASDSLIVQYVTGKQSPKMPLGGELPAAMIQSLEQAITPGTRQRMGAPARALAIANDAERNADGVVAAYRDALTRRTDPRKPA